MAKFHAKCLTGPVMMAKKVSITAYQEDGRIRITFTGEHGAGKTISRREAETMFTTVGARIVRSGYDDQTDTLVIQPTAGMDLDAAFDIAKRAARQAREKAAQP